MAQKSNATTKGFDAVIDKLKVQWPRAKYLGIALTIQASCSRHSWNTFFDTAMALPRKFANSCSRMMEMTWPAAFRRFAYYQLVRVNANDCLSISLLTTNLKGDAW